MNKTVKFGLTLAYNAALLVGTVWLIDARNWSPWWLLLTIGLMLYVRESEA